MRISVFGIGYVGAVSAACLAADGHEVVAVDTNPQKVKMINDGVAPIVETGLAELVREGAPRRQAPRHHECRRSGHGECVLADLRRHAEPSPTAISTSGRWSGSAKASARCLRARPTSMW